MFGKRPYSGNSRKKIKERNMVKQVRIKIEECSKGWSIYGIDFINRLLILSNK